jgi:signal transduction histidine kinase
MDIQNNVFAVVSAVVKVVSDAENTNRIMIIIRDTGSGIAAQDIRKIFEPFYTTKPVGTGTGLGLSLSYSIVQNHKGEIKVTSTLGVGTSFTVILPILTPADVFEC